MTQLTHMDDYRNILTSSDFGHNTYEIFFNSHGRINITARLRIPISSLSYHEMEISPQKLVLPHLTHSQCRSKRNNQAPLSNLIISTRVTSNSHQNLIKNIKQLTHIITFRIKRNIQAPLSDLLFRIYSNIDTTTKTI